MIRQQSLNRILSQANGAGVQYVLLLNMEGSLLAFSGEGEGNGNVTAAIARNIWSAYIKTGKFAFPNEKLEFLLLDCEEGKVAVYEVANALLCMCATSQAFLGLLKTKCETVSKYLEAPVSHIAPILES